MRFADPGGESALTRLPVTSRRNEAVRGLQWQRQVSVKF